MSVSLSSQGNAVLLCGKVRLGIERWRKLEIRILPDVLSPIEMYPVPSPTPTAAIEVIYLYVYATFLEKES